MKQQIKKIPRCSSIRFYRLKDKLIVSESIRFPDDKEKRLEFANEPKSADLTSYNRSPRLVQANKTSFIFRQG